MVARKSSRKSVKKTPSSKKAVVVRRKSVKKTVSTKKPIDRRTQLKNLLTSKNAKIGAGAAGAAGLSLLGAYLARQRYLKKNPGNIALQIPQGTFFEKAKTGAKKAGEKVKTKANLFSDYVRETPLFLRSNLFSKKTQQ